MNEEVFKRLPETAQRLVKMLEERGVDLSEIETLEDLQRDALDNPMEHISNAFKEFVLQAFEYGEKSGADNLSVLAVISASLMVLETKARDDWCEHVERYYDLYRSSAYHGQLGNNSTLEMIMPELLDARDDLEGHNGF